MISEGLSPKEIEIENLFCKLGYFTRSHIQVFPIDLKNSASDIDVFAVKLSPYLKPDLKLIEVKEGYGTATSLFQLYGFKSYFQASQAYLVAQRMHNTTREISKSLGIDVFTFDRLKSLVASEVEWMEQKKRTIIELDISHMKKIAEYLAAVKSLNEELFWAYHYTWLITDPYKKFNDLQRLFSKTGNLVTDEKTNDFEAISWFKRELFCLALLSAAYIASDCIDLENDKLFQYIENRFYNIGGSKEGKLKVKEGIEKLSEQIEQLSKGMVKVPPVHVIQTYVPNLVKLVGLLIKNAPYVQSYLTVDNNIFRADLKRENRNLTTFASSDAQYRIIRETNNLMLKIMYEGNPVEMTFKDFV